VVSQVIFSGINMNSVIEIWHEMTRESHTNCILFEKLPVASATHGITCILWNPGNFITVFTRLTRCHYAYYMSYKSQPPKFYRYNNIWRGVEIMHLIMQFPAVFSWPVDKSNAVLTKWLRGDARVTWRSVLYDTESDVCVFRMCYGSCLRVLGWICQTVRFCGCDHDASHQPGHVINDTLFCYTADMSFLVWI
jgi:hypothetical protein